MSKPLKNPLLEDFSVTYDTKGDNPKTITLNALEIKEFDEPYYSFLKKKLFDAYINKKNINVIALNANPEEMKKVMDKIEVDY